MELKFDLTAYGDFQIYERVVKPTGNSCHVFVPKMYEGEIAVIIVKKKNG